MTADPLTPKADWPATGLTDPPPLRMAARLCLRLLVMGRRRAWRVLALTAAGGMAEGIGVLALVPLLRMLGLDGDGIPGSRLLPALAGYLVLAGGAVLIMRARAIEVQAVTLDLLDRLRTDLHAAIMAMEWSRFRTLRTGAIQQSIMGEVGRIGYAVSQLAALSGEVLTIPFILAASLLLSWPLTLGALAMAGAVALLTRRLARKGYLQARDQAIVNRAAMADLADDLAGLRLIKGFGAEVGRTAGVAARFAAIRRNLLDQHRTQADERAALQLAAAAAAAATLYMAVGGLQMPLADALVLILAYGRVLQSALRGLASWRQLSIAVAALACYDETLEMCRKAAEPRAAGDAPPPRLEHALRLKGVSVSYPSEDGPRKGLDRLDAEFPAGRITAIVGPSGAGKSTLADLVSGLTAPDHGEIAIDGTPLTPSLRRAWRQRVAVVPQEAFLFHDTIAANLRLARPDADEDSLWRVLDAAAVAHVVRNLPQGLETVTGERGTHLSGGERQRIVLARALLREPDLLVLDEATAALDGGTEALVADTLTGLRGHCTVLVIAHRPSTVQAADHVLVLEAGRLAAAGTWEEVRALAGGQLDAMGLLI